MRRLPAEGGLRGVPNLQGQGQGRGGRGEGEGRQDQVGQRRRGRRAAEEEEGRGNSPKQGQDVERDGEDQEQLLLREMRRLPEEGGLRRVPLLPGQAQVRRPQQAEEEVHGEGVRQQDALHAREQG